MAQEQPHIEQWKSLLEQHITKDAAGKSVLHLASDTLPSPAIQAIFAEYLVDKTLSVDNVTLQTTSDSVTITGQGSGKPFAGLHVVATFAVDAAGEPSASITVTTTPAFANDWTLVQSFSSLAGTVFEDIHFSHPTLYLNSEDVPGGPKKGLFFRATLLFTGAMAQLGWLWDQAPPLVLAGGITIVDSAPAMILEVAEAHPVQVGYFHLPLRLSLLASTVPQSAPAAQPGHKITATIKLISVLEYLHNATSIKLPITAVYQTGNARLDFTTELASLANFGISELVSLLNNEDVASLLPAGFSLDNTLALSQLHIAVDLATKELVQVALEVHQGKPWNIVDVVSVTKVQLRFALDSPTSQKKELGVGISGDVVLFDKAVIPVSATYPDFTLNGKLEGIGDVNLGSFLARVYPAAANTPLALNIEDLILTAIPGKSTYKLEGTLSAGWQIPIAAVTLVMTQAKVTIAHEGGATRAQLTATTGIGDASFDVAWIIPGDFKLDGIVPTSTSLKELVNTAGGDLFSYPAVLPDISLGTITLSIDKQQAEYELAIGAQDSEWGAISFLVVKALSGWGLAGGFMLPPSWQLSKIPGVSSAFNSLHLGETVLLVATFDDPNLTVPGITLPGKQVGVIDGLNVLATLVLDGLLLGTVGRIIGETTLSIQAAIAAQPSETFLAASLGSSLTIPPATNVTLSGLEAGTGVTFELHPDPLSPSVAGKVTIPVGSGAVAIPGRLVISENAFTFAVDINANGGSLLSPLGFQGVTLDDIGMALSAEFVPASIALTLTGKFGLRDQASAANSFAFSFGFDGEVINPQLLSCQFPLLDLPIIFDSCMDSEVVLPALLNRVQLSDVFIFWCDAPTTLPDGTTTLPGYGLGGGIDFFGWHAHARLLMTFNSGIHGDGAMDPVHLGSGALSITGLTPGGGPAVKISTSASPYFMATINVSLLGLISESLQVEIANTGIQFGLRQHIYSFLDDSVVCTLSDALHFSFSSALNISVDLIVGPLTLPGSSFSLGTVHIQGRFGGSLAVQLNSQEFFAQVSGGIAWRGTTWAIPMLQITVPVSTMEGFLQAVLNSIITDASQIFSSLFNTAESWTHNVSAGVVTAATDIAAGLKSAYNETLQGAATILHEVGQSAEATAAGLKSAYAAGGEDVAIALKGAGYTVNQVGKALQTAYGWTDNQVATGLKDAGYNATDIAGVLETVYGESSQQIYQALNQAGYTVGEIQAAFNQWHIPHADLVAVPHGDVASQHIDTAASGHIDTSAQHGDIPTGPHFDVPHGDSDELFHFDTQHADTQTPHADGTAIPHGDTAGIPHVDQGTGHIDTAAQHGDVP